MKKKILLIGWADRITEKMLTHELKQLAEKYEILFADKFSFALAQIDKAKSVENPICALIFQRTSLIASPTMCKVVVDAAKLVSSRPIAIINIIVGASDNNEKWDSIGSRFCYEGEWENLKKMLNETL